MSTTRRRRRSAPAPPAREDVVDLGERKEKVLHTRVPQSLDRQIKQRARNLGMSVSTVVRHVLLNTFGLVEDIVTDSTNLAMSIAGEETAAPAEGSRRQRGARDEREPGDEDILGWQEVILNVNAVCERCNALLLKGAKAAMAIHERSGPRVVLCRNCLPGLSDRPGRQTRKPKRRRKTARRPAL